MNTRPTPGRRTAGTRKVPLQILLTCVGRRIELVQAFRAAADRLNVRLIVHGADINRLAPAMHRVDCAHIVPRITDPAHIPALLDLVRRHGIHMAIPLIDSDLLALSQAKPRFAELGCHVVISSEQTVRVCRDKLLTYQTLRDAGIDVPRTWAWAEALALKRRRYPLFLKPRAGSAGKGLWRVSSDTELRVLGARVDDPIVQEFVEGTEYTLDVYTGLSGRPRCAVPRRRIEVRTGEVSKGVIVKDPRIIDLGRRVIEALGPCEGVITVQCIVTPDRRIRVIEINPRFGGGAPLSIHAGADFPRWLMAEYVGRAVRRDPMAYRDDVMMLRYDQSVFVDNARELQDRPRRPRRSGRQ